jgi:hypothetical protein
VLPKVDQGRSTQLPPIGEGVLISYIQHYRKLTPHSKLQNRGDPTSAGQHVARQTPGKRPANALFGNRPTAADADWPNADWVRDMKVTGCSHEPGIEGT